MPTIERRKFIRKNIRMACIVRFPSGTTINGSTKDLSLDGVFIESSSVSVKADR